MQCKKIVLPAIAVLLMGYTLYCLNRFPVPSVEQLSSRRNSGISVFWNAPFLSGGGYCSEAISLIRALDKRGFDVHIQQHGDSVNQEFISGLSGDEQRTLWRLINKTPRNRQSTTIEVCHSEPGAWKPADYATSDCPQFSSEEAYHVGRTMFETDRIPKGWATKMNRMDEVWVPSTFMKEVFERGGVRHIRVVGESVDTAFFRPIPSLWECEGVSVSDEGVSVSDEGVSVSDEGVSVSDEGASETLTKETTTKETTTHNTPSVAEDPANALNITRAYLFDEVFERHPLHGVHTHVFLALFKWEYRKGWDLLLDMYFSAFSRQDRVSLFIVTQEYHEEHPIQQQVDAFIAQRFAARRSTLPHFKIVTAYTPQAFLPYFYNLATAVVLPTRGEGWGRVAQEAMACGRVVITTAYGGALTFVNQNNSIPIAVERFVPIQEGAFRGHQLVEPNREAFIAAMKSALQDRERMRLLGEEARRNMVEQYSEEVFGEALERELWRIQDIMRERGMVADL